MGKQLHVTAGIPAFLNPATKLLPQSHTTKCTLLLFSPVWYSLKGCACRQASLYSQFSSVQWHVKLNYETRVSEDHNISGNTNTMPLLDTWSFYLFTHWWNHCLGKVSMWTRCIQKLWWDAGIQLFQWGRKANNQHKSFQQLTDEAFLLENDQTETAVLWWTLLSVSVVMIEQWRQRKEAEGLMPPPPHFQFGAFVTSYTIKRLIQH